MVIDNPNVSHSVFMLRVTHGRRSVLPVDENSTSRFWRVVNGDAPETIYRSGEKDVDRIDLRVSFDISRL